MFARPTPMAGKVLLGHFHGIVLIKINVGSLPPRKEHIPGTSRHRTQMTVTLVQL